MARKILVLNRDFYRWSTIKDTKTRQTDDISVANGELLLQSDKKVRIERPTATANLQSSNQKFYCIKTDWINLSDFQGFSRLRRINTLYDVRGDARCRICYRIRYNYEDNNPDFLEEGHFTPAFTYRYSPSRIYRVIPRLQKCAAFNIEYYATTNVPFTISGLTLEYTAIGVNIYKKGAASG